jgi:hypothetical protein
MLQPASRTTFSIRVMASTAILAVLIAASSAAQISVSTTTLSFNVPQYVTSGPKAVVVTNIGAAPVTFGETSFAGTDAGDFNTTLDSCSLHTIAPNKKCKLLVEFSASAVGGSTETATLSINDSTGSALQSVALNGSVAKGPVATSLSGFTVSISNATKLQYGMDFSITGPYSDTGTGTCTDLVLAKSVCTIVLRQNSPGAGEISIHMAPVGKGKSYEFHIPLS